MLDVKVRHDGLEFRCQIDGDEGAPWLVFSNSLLTNLAMWDEQVSALAGSHRILRYDQRGHGGTDVPPARASIEQLADDAAALLEHFSIEQATFIGVSIGAATTICLAGRRNPRVAKAIAVDGQAVAPSTARQAWEERIAMAKSQGMEALAEATIGRWFRPESVASGLSVLSLVRQMIVQTPMEGFIACARALQDYDLRALLPRIQIPMLLLAGAADGGVPGAMREMQNQISGAEFDEIEGAGHLPSMEQPEAFLALVAAFLRQG